MGFIKDLRYLMRRLPPYDRRQSMLFSATLSFDVMELAYVFMNDAEKLSVSPEQVTAENIEHLVYHVGSHEKLPFLIGLIFPSNAFLTAPLTTRANAQTKPLQVAAPTTAPRPPSP